MVPVHVEEPLVVVHPDLGKVHHHYPEAMISIDDHR